MQTRRKPQSDFNAVHIFLGLLLGFFLGGSVMYLHSSRQNNKIIGETMEKLLTLFSESPQAQTNAAATGAAPRASNPLQAASPSDNQPLTHAAPDTIVHISSEEQQYLIAEQEPEETLPEQEEDFPATRTVTNPVAGHSYHMANDRLLHTRTIAVPLPSNRQSDAQKRLDSLVDNRNPQRPEQIFYVEFWESPLNSLVYRMGKNKIVFYGIRLFDLAGIYNEQGNFYLRYLNNYYPLEYTTTFKPLMPVNNQTLLEILQDI